MTLSEQIYANGGQQKCLNELLNWVNHFRVKTKNEPTWADIHSGFVLPKIKEIASNISTTQNALNDLKIEINKEI